MNIQTSGPLRQSENGALRVRPPQQRTGHRKSRGLTCGTCRSRKVRCDGTQPTCRMCQLHGDDCHYDKPPPMSQLVLMAKRLQEAEQAIAEIQGDAERSPDRMNSSHVDAASPTNVLSQPSPRPLPGASRAPIPSVQSSLDQLVGTERALINSTWNNGPSATSYVSESTLKETTASELTVDEHGGVRYYGPTSAVHEPSPAMLETNSPDSVNPEAKTRASLTAHARESAIWEEFAIGNASAQTGIPRQVIAKLLHIHWTWVAPMFLWIHPSAFIHDMATGGRHYSEFLLTVICAHAGKYEDAGAAEMLATRAKALLGQAIQQRSSIPTVQALLQLSAMELAQGSMSQAWVYSGIAFRMASDLGLQHVNKKITGLSPVDLEVRRRLYWSCYFWDKAISLYTGRMPSVTEVTDHSSLDLLDDTADSNLWTPYFADTLNLTRHSQTPYPPTSSHTVSCFVNSCKLAIIINDIISTLYHRRSKSVVETVFRDLETRLERWRISSPPLVKLDPHDLPSVCPPPHIVSQNMLYFASVILTHRPFWSVPQHYKICVQAADCIERLVLLLETTFGLENITYLMGYCIYTGASVSLEDARKMNNREHPTLRTFIRALNGGMRRCRLLERSLNIIIKELSSSFHDGSAIDGGDRQALNDATTATSGSIPAFPYVDPVGAGDFDFNSYFSEADISTMNTLDFYPETQMDLSSILGNMA